VDTPCDVIPMVWWYGVVLVSRGGLPHAVRSATQVSVVRGYSPRAFEMISVATFVGTWL
jgi:hypothetical protein